MASAPRDEPQPTMRSIAAAAGVSRSTVSLALRGSRKIGAATRERIQRLAAELGYRQDPYLRRWMRRMRQREGALPPLPLAWLLARPLATIRRQHPVHRLFLEGARERAEALGYDLQPWWTHDPELPGIRLLELLQRRGIAALVLSHPLGDLPAESFAAFAVASIGDWDAPAHGVIANQHAAMRLVLGRVRAAGCRRPALVIAESLDRTTRHLFSDAIRGERLRAGEDGDAVLVLAGDRQAAHEAALLPWVERQRPDAILCHKPWPVACLARAGRLSPRDYAFVHLNRLTRSDRRFAGLDQRSATQGAAAVELVDAQLQRGERGLVAEPQRLLLGSAWCPGPTLQEG